MRRSQRIPIPIVFLWRCRSRTNSHFVNSLRTSLAVKTKGSFAPVVGKFGVVAIGVVLWYTLFFLDSQRFGQKKQAKEKYYGTL